MTLSIAHSLDEKNEKDNMAMFPAPNPLFTALVQYSFITWIIFSSCSNKKHYICIWNK